MSLSSLYADLLRPVLPLLIRMNHVCCSTTVETAAKSFATLVATTPQPCRTPRNPFAFVTSVTCSWWVVTRARVNSNIVRLVVHRSSDGDRTIESSEATNSSERKYWKRRILSRTYTHTSHTYTRSRSRKASGLVRGCFQFSTRHTGGSEKNLLMRYCLASRPIFSSYVMLFGWLIVSFVRDLLDTWRGVLCCASFLGIESRTIVSEPWWMKKVFAYYRRFVAIFPVALYRKFCLSSYASIINV